MKAIDKITDLQFSTEGLRDAVAIAWEDHILEVERRERREEPQRNVYASQFHPCERHLFLNITRSHELPEFGVESLARFRRGKDRERDIRQDLDRIGRLCIPAFDVVKQQERFELKDREGWVVITGKVDGRLKFSGVSTEPPFEVKSWAPHLIAKVRTFEDLMSNKWTRAGAFQLLAYLFGSGSEFGFMILDRGGIPELLLAELTDENLNRVEQFLTLATSAVARKRNKLESPEFIRDSSVCPSCKWFGSFCNPPTFSGFGAAVFAGDEFAEVEAQIDRHDELKPFAKEYDSLHDDLTRKFRGVERGILGHWLIEGKWSKMTKYNVPDNIREQYKEVTEKGKFSVKFVSIGGEPGTAA